MKNLLIALVAASLASACCSTRPLTSEEVAVKRAAQLELRAARN